MKRGKSPHMLALREDDPLAELPPEDSERIHVDVPDDITDLPPLTSLDHPHARALILEQAQRLLPADEANALADHLLECDRCFRFAQDVAARERHRHATP